MAKDKDPHLEIVKHIPRTWVREWPYPPIPGGQLFVGHKTRLAEVRTAFEAAGYVVRNTKPDGHSLELAQENEIELVRRGRKTP